MASSLFNIGLSGLRAARGSLDLTAQNIANAATPNYKARDIDFQTLYEDHYRNDPFVDVLPPGSHPETRSVRASNMLRIAVHRPGGGDQLVILVVEDNLVKGAAGQGVQCMNLMFGLEETTGLRQVPILP